MTWTFRHSVETLQVRLWLDKRTFLAAIGGGGFFHRVFLKENVLHLKIFIVHRSITSTVEWQTFPIMCSLLGFAAKILAERIIAQKT